jgi:hypothetical protein
MLVFRSRTRRYFIQQEEGRKTGSCVKMNNIYYRAGFGSMMQC